jgi:hypothetical protein
MYDCPSLVSPSTPLSTVGFFTLSSVDIALLAALLPHDATRSDNAATPLMLQGLLRRLAVEPMSLINACGKVGCGSPARVPAMVSECSRSVRH